VADPGQNGYKPECDPAAVAILGDYIGAQMAGFNVEAVLGLIDHLQDGDLDQPYTDRTVVVGGNTPYAATVSAGALPAGLHLDATTGVLSGTPTEAGLFAFTVSATDADAVQVSRAYTLRINGDAPADACPDDPAKTDPGICGCGIPDTDSDADGAADCLDQCANDPDKTDPGVCGCGVADADSDGDGTADCDDGCASDPAKTTPGVCGCGITDADSDGDGTADCDDGCASDPAKTTPGVCGCGIADADSDGDGAADCQDACPSDPAKADPGFCGCGIADTDTDGDGVPNCTDQCPTDPAKTVPGACGCGVADADVNHNGTADCLETSRADLQLTLVAKGKPAKVGRRLAYQLVVRNAGPDTATAVTASVECSGVPFHVVTQASDCIVSGATFICPVEPLRPRRADKPRLVLVPEATGVLHCSATVSSAVLDPNPADNDSTADVQVKR
jgi:hypothetical protein